LRRGYPAIGVYFAKTPTSGREMIALYSRLGTGTPFDDFVQCPEGSVSCQKSCFDLMIIFRFTSEPFGYPVGGCVRQPVRDGWGERVAVGHIVNGAARNRPANSAEAETLRQFAAA
jgi:hypothetical protein